MKISISARRLAMFFTAVVGLLIGVHTILQTVRFVTGDHSLMGLLALTSLGSDVSVPAFYSAVAILFCGVLLAMIACGELWQKGYRPAYWFVLSAIFLFLSIDEMLSIHENLVSSGLPFAGYGLFYYGWVAPYTVAAVLFVLVYLRFLIGLPRRTAWLFVSAGAVYFCGAVGFEIVGGYIAQDSGTVNVPYVIVQSIEEIAEMMGIVAFLYALADYAERRFGGISIELAASADNVETVDDGQRPAAAASSPATESASGARSRGLARPA